VRPLGVQAAQRGAEAGGDAGRHVRAAYAGRRGAWKAAGDRRRLAT
jgi:hypothetical protein